LGFCKLRWKRRNDGTKIFDKINKKPILQFVGIQRRDSGKWALPGVNYKILFDRKGGPFEKKKHKKKSFSVSLTKHRRQVMLKIVKIFKGMRECGEDYLTSMIREFSEEALSKNLKLNNKKEIIPQNDIEKKMINFFRSNKFVVSYTNL
jgi:hypothetical protein